jgi:hypothetical protein
MALPQSRYASLRSSVALLVSLVAALAGWSCSVHEHSIPEQMDADGPDATALAITCGYAPGGGCVCGPGGEFVGLDSCSAASLSAGSPGDEGLCCSYGNAVVSTCSCSLIGCRSDPSTGDCRCEQQLDADGGTPEMSCPNLPGQQCCLADYAPLSCHCGDGPCDVTEHPVQQCALSDIMTCEAFFSRVSSCK